MGARGGVPQGDSQAGAGAACGEGRSAWGWEEPGEVAPALLATVLATVPGRGTVLDFQRMFSPDGKVLTLSQHTPLPGRGKNTQKDPRLGGIGGTQGDPCNLSSDGGGGQWWAHW